MRRKARPNFWEFLSKNILSLLTVISGISVIIWQAVSDPTNLDPVSLAILALLCLLATSHIVETQNRLDNIERTINSEFSRIINPLPHSEFRKFSDFQEYIKIVTEKMLNAEHSIDWASIDVTARTSASEHQKQLFRVRHQIVKKGKIRFRYLFCANEKRIPRIKEMISHCCGLGKLFIAGYSSGEQNIPMMSFIIIDDEEIFTRNPYEFGENAIYVSLKNPLVKNLFEQWFTSLWTNSIKINPTASFEEQCLQLDNLLSNK